MKTNFKLEEIIEILDQELRKNSEEKNAYIAKNGYRHKDTLQAFDTAQSTIISLMYAFKKEAKR